ncbi:DNA-binding transcriptional MerR regulator [Stackebrandtia endophytica]|uniref:DNA-binding transcriptional MerR regulator n=1 Tax=Stackebrandtia endophytica TaxID=1496996 RepID=A0A543ARY3_9ACTN|nr:MerR family transcriptional regulator [Stackebrandtia endophytica]TQL75337.1 DNA-binding transcriptional MerR regulator [Stackebrandtia endophytica]
MSHRDLLTIGAFSMRTGLSIPALRHYDEVGLLEPAQVDPGTGYRRYRDDQAERARAIARLRAVDLPLSEVREVLEGSDPSTVLKRHRARLNERATAVTQMVDSGGRFLQEGSGMKVNQGIRMVQVTAAAPDLATSVEFYTEVFGVDFIADLSAFQFGGLNYDSFFMLSLDEAPGFGPIRFGLYVDDVDEIHTDALKAGAVSIQVPTDHGPRRSIIDDPAGNRITLYQR